MLRNNCGLPIPVPAEEVTTSAMQGGSDPANAGRWPVWLDRVTAPDLMLIWPEEQGWAQYIGALVILGGRSLFGADGRFLIGPVREAIGRRLHLVPRFRQVLCWPRTGLGWPVWADAQSFDITQHVRVHPVPSPGDERQLLLACETLRRRPLPRGRPLWEMWFLTGLPGQRVGLFMKMHHAIADGVAGVATLAAFVDPVPGPPEVSAPAWSPSPLPSASLSAVLWDRVTYLMVKVALLLATPPPLSAASLPLMVLLVTVITLVDPKFKIPPACAEPPVFCTQL